MSLFAYEFTTYPIIMITSGNELNTCNGISKTGRNYKYKYNSNLFQIEYCYRYVISCVLIQKMYDGQT